MPANSYGSPKLWSDVQAYADSHVYMHGVERTVERVANTGEVFTPTQLIIELLSKYPLTSFSPGKTVLDPACGDGQFLVVAKAIKMLEFKMSEKDALEDLYGVDIMRDNVDLALRRLRGGHIVMGNTLEPRVPLHGQTPAELALMVSWFA